MTRNTKIQGYTELDILMFQAGAPTRFDSPYWTVRKVDWSAVGETLVKPAYRLATSIRVMVLAAIRPSSIS